MGIGGNFADYNGSDWKIPGGRSRQQQIATWFDTTAFGVNALGTIGSGRRNQLIGPGAWNADYSLFKSFFLREKAELQFRGEFFNVFNHTRLNNPTATVTSTAFGQITSAADPRIVQLALRLRF
jgi:hypothetical protein